MIPLFLPSLSIRLIILVIAIGVLAIVSPVKSCHRRVEYHHYKKQPHKGWGWGWKGEGHGHKGGHGHGGGHGQGYGEQKGYHMKGYQMGYGKGHDEYGGGHEKGHKKGHGHGGGHAHKGYGEQKGYGHQMKGYGHDDEYGGKGHKGGGHGKGYGHGEQKGHGYGHNSEHGGGYESSPMHKGLKYKHSSYEMATYGNKGNKPYGRDMHHNQEGYGYSGPYPNTEYSSNVHSAVNPARNEVGGLRFASSSLNPADVADYIRSSKSSKTGRGSSFLATPILLDTLPHASSNPGSEHSKGESSEGNFDLNLDFNGGDIIGPYRRNGNDEGSRSTSKKRKKLSSTFKAKGEDGFSSYGEDNA